MVDPDTFLTTLYVMVDEFCQSHLLPEVHPGPPASLSRSEVVTLGLFEQWARFPGEACVLPRCTRPPARGLSHAAASHPTHSPAAPSLCGYRGVLPACG